MQLSTLRANLETFRENRGDGRISDQRAALQEALRERISTNNPELVAAIEELRTLVTNSVDNPPIISREDRQSLHQAFRAALADGVTPEELADLGDQVSQLLTEAGLTPEETTAIFSQIQAVAALTDREPRREGEIFIQVQAALADGSVSEAEKEALRQTTADNLNDRLANLDPEVVAQRQALRTLITDSIDNSITPPTREEIQEKLQELRDVLAGGLTPAETQELLQNASQSLTDLGITAPEAHAILLQRQSLGAFNDRVPETSDSLTGTRRNDFLRGQNGNDTLTGASGDDGRSDVDILSGGAGADTFVLGNSTTVFYDDRVSTTTGTQDYALILDFDPNNGDLIQLNGAAANYTLGAIPQELTNTFSNLGGTALSTTSGELIGVIFGVTVADFTAGFTFV